MSSRFDRIIPSLAWLAAAAIAASALGAAGCGPRTRRTPDDTIVALIETPMKSADPRYAITTLDLKLSKLVAPGLVTVDTADQSPRLDLAERIDRVDDVTYEVTLRADARFSTGDPVTADDVAWTLGSVIAKGSDSLFHKNLSERFSRIEPTGPRTVRLHLHRPLATLMTDLDFGIISRKAARPDGSYPGGRVVGAGPYRLLALETHRVLLEANPHYHGGRPRTPRLEIRTVRDASARILMLVGGSADLAQNAVRLDLVDDVARRPRIQIASGPSSILTYLLINNADPVLADVRVRRAIALAIDKPAIIAAKLSGRAAPATTLLPRSHWAHAGDLEAWDHDPARARQLLDEAGLRDPDGPGPAPRLRLTYKTSSDLFRVAIARIIAAELGEVGIDVDVRPFEFATFFADVKKGTYQLASMQTTDIGEPDFYLTLFHSSRIPDAKQPDGYNRWRYRNARIDELTEQGRRELDRDRRRALYGEVQRIIAADVPIVPLWHEDNIVVSNREVEGYVITPNARLGGFASVIKKR